MGDQARVMMTSPDHYEVCYAINPWMKPEAWAADDAVARGRAQAQWAALAAQLQALGLTVEVAPAEPGLPDLVFPANAGIVLNRRALLARFRHAERRGEESCFLRFFEGLRQRGLLDEVVQLPPELFQEGAGDCIWDAGRQWFWAGHGPRSAAGSLDGIRSFFGQTVIGLELVTERFYHLDTCFAALSGGEILYYPPAFSAEARATLAEMVPADRHIEATADEAAAFSLNAVNIGRQLIMAPPPPRLRAILEDRGYRCLEVDLSSFILSGGAAFCMTLRLDLASRAAA